MPFAFLTIPMGYAYHEAFEGKISKFKRLILIIYNLGGYLYGFFVVSSGLIVGSVCAFLISRSQIC